MVETTLETIPRPAADPDTAAMRSASEALATRATGIEITGAEGLQTANALGSDVATTIKAVEKRRKFFVEPLNRHVKEINGLFKAISEPLERADAALRQKIVAYRAAEQKKIDDARRAAEAQAREEERLAREKAAAAEAARLAGNNRQAAALERSATAMQTKAETTATTAAALLGAGQAKSMSAGDGAKNKASRVWKFEVLDDAQVPRQYLAVDETAIRKAVAAGVRDIPGVNIYETEQIAFASRR